MQNKSKKGFKLQFNDVVVVSRSFKKEYFNFFPTHYIEVNKQPYGKPRSRNLRKGQIFHIFGMKKPNFIQYNTDGCCIVGM